MSLLSRPDGEGGFVPRYMEFCALKHFAGWTGREKPKAFNGPLPSLCWEHERHLFAVLGMQNRLVVLILALSFKPVSCVKWESEIYAPCLKVCSELRADNGQKCITVSRGAARQD
jgi:hypothetical protein